MTIRLAQQHAGSRHSTLRPLLALGVAQVLSACGGSAGAESKSADGTVTTRPIEIIHEECDVEGSSAEKLDANGDGRPDVTSVKSGNAVSCQAFDLNFDGKIDSWVYFDASGKVRRREIDYDRDGRIDEISIFRSGVLSEKHRATTLNNRLDTWDFFSAGKLARTERDSDGDAVVDQWWEYPKADCPLIHSDVDGDGRPDPGATIDYCKETGYVPPSRNQNRQAESPDFQPQEALPTELETKPSDGAAPPPANGVEGGSQPSGEGE
jgi:hypothetical protein